MSTDPPSLLVVVAGPTAVGKTSLSIRLARHFSTAIISADSRQFYREMRIGTARPSAEEMKSVPHYFIGHLSIHEPYDIARFETDALDILEQLFLDHRVVIMTGGSGLYIHAVIHGVDDLPDPDPAIRETLESLYHQKGINALRAKLKLLDPVYYDEADISNPRRLLRALEVCMSAGIPYSSLRRKMPKQRNFSILRIGLSRERAELNRRIDARVDRMIAEGLPDEARQLLPFRHLNALNTVGYKEIFEYLEGRISQEEAAGLIKKNTRHYAKRQMTWFRKDPQYRWFHPDQGDEILEYIEMNRITGP
jgi:tRNA dimethylallyltransferase